MPKIQSFESGPGPRATPVQAPGLAGEGSGLNALAQSLETLSATAEQAQVAADTQAANVALVKTREQLAGLENEKTVDPATGLETPIDFDTFSKRSTQIVRENEKKITNRGVKLQFSTSAGNARSRALLSIQTRDIERTASKGREDLTVTLRSLSSLAAKTQGVVREEFLQNAEEALNAAEAGGLISPENRGVRRQRFNDNLTMSEIRRGFLDDPAETTKALLANEFDIDPERREVLIREGIRQAESVQREARMAEERARRDLERAENKQAEVTTKNLIEQALVPDETLTLQEVLDQKHLLTPEKFEKLLKVARDGGRITSTPKGDRGIELDLQARANEDMTPEELEQFSSELQSAFLDRRITEEDFRRIDKSSKDVRFKDAEKLLRDGLKVGESVIGFTARNQSAEALALFSDWKLARPNATREEAFEKARQLKTSAQSLLNLDDVPSAQLLPRFAVGGAKNFDAKATRRTTDSEFRRKHGIPDGTTAEQAQSQFQKELNAMQNDIDWIQELDKIDRLQRAVEASAERKKAKEAKADAAERAE